MTAPTGDTTANVTSVVDNGVTDSTATSPADTQSTTNPAWEGVLKDIPKEFHGKITPFLSENDKKYQQLSTRYSSLKDIPDENVSHLANLYSYLNDDNGRRELYNQLGKALGITPQEAQQVAQQAAATQQQPTAVVNQPDAFEDPRDKTIRELQERQDNLQKVWEAEQQERKRQAEVERYGQQFDQQLAQIMQSDPNADIERVKERALAWMALQETRGIPTDQIEVDLIKFHQAIKAEDQIAVQQYLASRGQPYTAIAPTSGGTEAPTIDTSSREGRLKGAYDVIQRMKTQGG